MFYKFLVCFILVDFMFMFSVSLVSFVDQSVMFFMTLLLGIFSFVLLPAILLEKVVMKMTCPVCKRIVHKDHMRTVFYMDSGDLVMCKDCTDLADLVDQVYISIKEREKREDG